MDSWNITIGGPSQRKEEEQRHAGFTAGQTIRFLRAKTKAETKTHENETILGMPEPKEIRPDPWLTAEGRAKAIQRMKRIGIPNAEEISKFGPDAVDSLIEVARDDQPNILEQVLRRMGNLIAVQGPPNESYKAEGPRK